MAYLGTLQGEANVETLINTDQYGFQPRKSDPFAMLDGQMLGRSWWGRQKRKAKNLTRQTGNLSKQVWVKAGKITDVPAVNQALSQIPLYAQVKAGSKTISSGIRSGLKTSKPAPPPFAPSGSSSRGMSLRTALAKAKEAQTQSVENESFVSKNKWLLIGGGAVGLFLLMRKK